MSSALEHSLRNARQNVSQSFSAHLRQQEYVRKEVVAPPQKDKQGPCTCGYDQSCTTLVCGGCGRKAPHNEVSVISHRDDGSIRDFFYRACSCGGKSWLYGCEVFAVQRIN